VLRIQNSLRGIISLAKHGFLWNVFHYCLVKNANVVNIVAYEQIKNIFVIWIFSLHTRNFVLSYVHG